MYYAILSSIGGFIFLYFGAEALVKGSSSLGLRLGLTPLVVGLTIVAFGTSAPELAVSMNAAYAGQTDIAVGNVVGSNIANIGLILGLSALVRPLHIDIKLIRIDVPIMIGVSALFCVLILDHQLAFLEGAMLFAVLLIYVAFSIVGVRKTSRTETAIYEAELPAPLSGVLIEIILVVAGLAMLVVGGRFLVNGAVQIARIAGVSEAVIGLTIVAVGTSLPELATSIIAAAKNMSDISVGNIVGSNIFNLLCVLGASALLAPLPLGNVTWRDIGVMMAFSIAILPLMRSGFLLKRRDGLILFVSYLIYITMLIAMA